MKRIFLDTNIFLRFYLKDNQSQFESCRALIEDIEAGKFRIYTSSIIFLEISYVLKSVYKLPFAEVVKILDSIFTIRGITVLEKTNTSQALEYFKKYKIKFTDCLIASQIEKNMDLITFDEELGKIKEIITKTPQELE